MSKKKVDTMGFNELLANANIEELEFQISC
jgi:phosphoribosylformylglycinamidine (FGAM) synthase PurS component